MNLRSLLSLAALFAACLPAPATTLDDARALLRAGKPDDAIARLETGVRNGGADGPALAVELARTQLATGRLISAQNTVERFLRETPADPQRNAMTLLDARLREATGNLAEAHTLYRALAGQTPAVPERAEALAGAIRAAGLLDNANLAERSLAEFTESYPQDPRTHDYLLQLYRQRASQKDERGAADAAHRFKTAFPQDPAGAAFQEFYHLAAAGDAKAAIAAFQAERKLPTYTLDFIRASAILEAMRHDPGGYDLIEPLATEFANATGDPRLQITAVESLPALNRADRAVAIGNQLLPKLLNSAWEPRLRLALANALWRAQNGGEAEKQLAALLALDPANAAAWSLHWDIVSAAKRPEAHAQLLEQTLAALPSQKNLTLRLNAQSLIRYSQAQTAWNQGDADKALKAIQTFLETDGLANSGAEVIKLAATICFAGLPEAVKANDEAAAELQTARRAASATAAIDQARTKAAAARETLDETLAASSAKFDALLPSLEKYLTRTIAWGSASDSLDATFRPLLALEPLADEGKKFHEMLQRVKQNDLVKVERSGFGSARSADKTRRASRSGEVLLPKLLEAGGALGLEGGNDIIGALYEDRQWEKVIAAGKLYFAKYPGATGPLQYVAAAAAQIGAPKNRELAAYLDDAVAKAGGNTWPHENWVSVRSFIFTVAEQNHLPAEMQAQFKFLTDLYPGISNAFDAQRRLGIAYAAAGELEPAKQALLAAAKAAQPTGSDPAVLLAISTSFSDAADWALPMLDAYLARPSRGPQQGSIQLLRCDLLVTEKKDINAAVEALQAAAARPGDMAWSIGLLPVRWAETLSRSASSAKVEDAKPEQIALLSNLVTVLGPQQSWLSSLMPRQAWFGQNLEFADNLNRLTAASNSNDGIALTTVFIPLSQQLAALNKPELAGLVLRAAVNRFSGVDPNLRSQASQALFSLSNQYGFPAAEIDDKLEWSPLLKAAMNLRMGDPVAAWKIFQENEALFEKHQDKLPADFLRWVSDRLLQRDDDPSREMAEEILNRWITANEDSTVVPAEEKAKTQFQLADFYFKTMRYDLARSECTSLINRFPGTPEAVDAQFRIGECYLNQKMYVDSAKVFEGMAKSKDKLIASRGEFLLGVQAQEQGDTEDAKARFRNVMDLAPSNDVADSILYRLSELYGQENRFSDELTLLRSIGLVGSTPKQWHTPGEPLNIVLQDADLGVSRGQSYVPVVVTTSGGDREIVRLESGSAGKGFFRGELPTELGDPKPGDHVLQVSGTDIITYDYPDDFKKQFTGIAPPPSNIRLASDAEFKISAAEIKDDEEITFEERLRQQREIAGKQAGLEYRQEFRKGNELKPGNNIYLQVKDAARDISKARDTVKVLVTAASGSRVTATLTETGNHTGIFRGTLKTTEVAANIFASDQSGGNEAVRAIDNDIKTAWEGLDDGRAPKFIVVDLKTPAKLGELKWSADGSSKNKMPVEYAVQVSNDLTDWTTIAATANFTGATKEQTGRIDPLPEGGLAGATAKLAGAEGRYVRLMIEKFTGAAPRIGEIEVSNADGVVLIPAQSDASAVTGEALRLTPSDRITATYENEINITTPGKPRTLTQELQATYYNGKIDFIAYEFRAAQGRSEPDKYIKQVRRAEPGQRVIVRITDYDCDTSDQRDRVKFTLKTSDGKETPMEAIETENFSGVFTKEFDIWSPEHPDGFKLAPGVSLEASYLDEQNTDPGVPVRRIAHLDAATPGAVKVAFVPTTVQIRKDGSEAFLYAPVPDSGAPAIKPVAYRPPLTFEIIDPAAAKDSFSEVKATLTTSSGASVEVICPLASFERGRIAERRGIDEALESGHFIGQIFVNLGDKDSPSTLVLEPGDTRTLVPRRGPDAIQDPQMANVVPVLNINGQDIITVTYTAGGKEYKDQARLSEPPSGEFTDNTYEKPVDALYLGDKIYLSIHDLTADATPDADAVEVHLTSSRGGSFTARLRETLSHSGEFTGSFPLAAAEKPTPNDDKLEAWFGDTITLTYTSKTDPSAKFEKTIDVVKGTDMNLLVFEKKYSTEQVAIESQFRMAEAYFELFKNYHTLKQEADASNALNEGMELLKELREDYPSKTYEARTDYLLGQFAQELKKYDEAIGYYKRIVQNHSDSPLAPDAQYKLGQCYEEKGDIDAASAEYVTLAYTWPDNPLVANVVVRIAEYFYNKKDYPAAAEVSMKFVERFPQHEWAERMLFRAAQCRFKADQFAEAGQDFDMLVENYPRGTFRPDALFWAGESYRSARQLDIAFRRYKRVTWDYPESDAAKFARGKLVLPEMVNVADKDVPQ